MHYIGDIKGIRETEEGTELLITISKEFIQYDILHKRIGQAEIRFDDGRSLSIKQRNKIFATINDISEYLGIPREELREELTWLFCMESGYELFSLSYNSSNVASMDVARDFITFLIDFILKHNIPLSDLALSRTEDIGKYLYSCIRYRRCVITGRYADIHHVEGSRIGMGGNRYKTSHKDREIIALCREWHDRVHREGEIEIFKAYKIYGIKVDVGTLRDLGISEEELT